MSSAVKTGLQNRVFDSSPPDGFCSGSALPGELKDAQASSREIR